jgi:hypothetical protein
MVRSVRPTQDELARTLPGDELIPVPQGGILTHAVTIHRPPRAIWPWLVQMGAGSRAGWYSYDLLDNGRRPSADRIVPALQEISIGAIFPAMPGVTDGFRVLAFEPERYLVLGWAPEPGGIPWATWAFVLEPIDDTRTRVITRARGSSAYPFYGLPPVIGRPLVRMAHFIMERKQLLGLARRAESMAPAVGARRTEAA